MSEAKQWTGENVKGILNVQYKIDRVLYSQQSAFQKVEVVESEGFGRMLFNDDVGMLSERDEFIYHDMIAHVPLFTHPNPKKVLVIGGGDGGTIREALRHPSVERAVLVEIDQCVVDACKEFIPQVSKAFDDPRCEVLIDDGAKFVAETKETFDVVLVDSTDPIGPSMPLFNVNFYTHVHRILSDNGIVVSQGESPYYFEEEQKSLVSIVGDVFSDVYLYRYANLAYPGGMWCFVMGTKGSDPLAEDVIQRAQAKSFETEYYTPKMHQASFVLPAFLEKRFRSQVRNAS